MVAGLPKGLDMTNELVALDVFVAAILKNLETELKTIGALLLAVNEAEAWHDDEHGYNGRLEALKPCYKILDEAGLVTKFESEAKSV